MRSSLTRVSPRQIYLLSSVQDSKLSRSVHITSKTYNDGKSVYEREEEGKKPRTVFGQEYPDWRKPWVERHGEWKTKLSVFNERNPSPEIMNAFQSLPNFDFSKLRDWWSSMKARQEIENQRYLPLRVAALGANLAAVHFFTYRRAAVRLKDSKEWIAGEVPQLNLPDHFEDGYKVEAIDCSNFLYNGIRYEGLQNLNGLSFLKWLSLKNQKLVDVWCLDRLAGQNGHSLEYLDLTGVNLTESCIFALARMPALKMVVITDPQDNIPVQAALSFLEQERPNLMIKAVDVEYITIPHQPTLPQKGDSNT